MAKRSCYSVFVAPGEVKAKPKIPPKLRLAGPADAKIKALPAHRLTPQSLLASVFHELLPESVGDEPTVLAFAVSAAVRAAGEAKNLCLCGLAHDRQEHGALYGHGIAGLGLAPERLFMVTTAKEKDLLWTLEEAVSSGGFGAVIGVLGAHERLYAFPASRRLKLRVVETGTRLFLLRHHLSGGATAAHGRWRVAARPSRSEGPSTDLPLLGPPRLQFQLKRMASLPPQQWEMEFDAARGFHLAPLLENGPDRAADGWRRQSA